MPLLLVLAGFVALAAGLLIPRSLGERYRVGRLLAATPVVSVAEAQALAAGAPHYVGVQGRIDAEAEFEDDAHRPLVLRRTRIQLAEGRGWRTVDEERRAVPFEVREGLDAIAVDADHLDAGLVVVPRESVGTAGDIADRVPSTTDPATPARLRVEQVSSVEHAIVLGVPRPVADGDGAMMTAGMGRPLVLTTLERPEAMRVLADGRTTIARLTAATLAVGAGLIGLGVVWGVLALATGTALAASPAPSGGIGGDPRSDGQGPGLVGEPLLAIGLVIGIGLTTALVTTAYVRVTAGREGRVRR